MSFNYFYAELKISMFVWMCDSFPILLIRPSIHPSIQPFLTLHQHLWVNEQAQEKGLKNKSYVQRNEKWLETYIHITVERINVVE